MNTAEKKIIKKYATIDDIIRMLENARQSDIDWDMPSGNKSLSKGYMFNILAKSIAELKKSGNVKSTTAIVTINNAIDEFCQYLPLTEEMLKEISEYKCKYGEMRYCHMQEPISIDEFRELLK